MSGGDVAVATGAEGAVSYPEAPPAEEQPDKGVI